MRIKTIKTLTALLILSLLNTAQAATIIVNGNDGLVNNTDGVCSISEAIINANDDAATHADCVAGSGADIIEITNDITLAVQYENDGSYGRTGTPAISTALTINGNGNTIQRLASLTCNSNNISDVGEFRILRTTTTADLQLENITISQGCVDDNSGERQIGGGLYNSGNLSLNQVTFRQNQAGLFGGGLYHVVGVISLISNSLFKGNSAGQGGGLTTQGAITRIENSTFSGNSASSSGGGILIEGSTITTITNSSFSGNTATSSGGAIYIFGGTITNLNNSLFHTNGNNECFITGVIGPPGSIAGSNNLSDQTTSGCPNTPSSASINLGPLADNGGATLTHALLAGSAAIDAGDGSATTSDQRGFGLNGVRDIGAFEAQIVELCPSALLVDGFTTTVATDVELIQAMECSNVNGNTNTDTINLSADIVLTQTYDNDATFGTTATPLIATKLSIVGNGFSLNRSNTLNCTPDNTIDADEFRLMRSMAGSDLSLSNIIVSNGCANGTGTQRFGAGLYSEGLLSLERVIFRDNYATERGGAIYHNAGIVSAINNSLFDNNYARYGGAIFTRNEITAINNSTFSNNTGVVSGSTILMSSNSQVIGEINNVTFADNTRTQVLGFENGTVTLINNSSFVNNSGALFKSFGTANVGNITNTLFHNNTSDCNGVTIAASANNLRNGTTASCGTLASLGAATNIAAALADNGCTTTLPDGSCVGTYALLAASNALDATNNGTSTDARGYNTDGIRDIGAYETQVPVVIAPADITMEATGATTSVPLGTATVTDVDETGLTANADMSSPFALAMHTVTWSATDNAGNTGTATQLVNVQAVVSGTVSGLTGTLTLQNNGGDDVVITADGGFRFATALNNLSSYAVTVLNQPVSQFCTVNNASGQVNGNNISDILVNCTDLTLALDTTSLDFSGVFIGTSKSLPLTISNTSLGAVTLNQITNPSAPFTITSSTCSPLPLTLNPNDTCQLIVSFEPTFVGGYSASIDIISDAVSSPNQVTLSGIAAVQIIPTLNIYGLIVLILSVLFLSLKMRFIPYQKS